MMPVFLWDPVALDCQGQPEASVSYVVSQALKEPGGYRTDCAVDPDTGEDVCVSNIVYLPMVLVSEEVVEGTEYPQESVYMPGPGGVTFIDVEALDLAGNLSGAPCL